MAIKIYNPFTQTIEQETVCSEAFLKFLYENRAGKFLLWALIKRAAFSKIFGLWADCKISKRAALKFMEDYAIRIGELKKRPSEFLNFNDFFTRELKDGARPLSEGKNDISFPADARHLAFQNVDCSDSFYAKNQKFDLEKFFRSAELAKRFENGAMLISRLSPLDYHRFHCPISGILQAQKTINGSLYSVSPLALRQNLAYLFENKRILNLIELQNGGLCAMVEIGATNVGTIVEFAKVGDILQRGKCKGMFKFGGSCVITIFEKDLATFDDEILKYSKDQIEYYELVNKKVGVLNV